jgi:hypothetical protein
MNSRSRAVALVAVALALASVPVKAHHSWTQVFSEDKPVILHGKLAKVELLNPHSWIWIDVKNPDGTVTKYGVEGGAPNGLVRNGITKASFTIGEELIVRGYGARDGSQLVAGVSFTRADGKEFFLANEGAEKTAKEKGNLK